MANEEKLLCRNCNTELERQMIGLNTFYCCRECLSMTSVREMINLKLDMMRSIGTIKASS
ncbi:hypothetical protein [Methanococcoides methylutens]|uniref:hypothetical protein n=1 Tax=Methanococcoides methylutens TaxID=2226 RepID=UPI00108401EC|nr:hypothetical protein [Methanococcoides methylutens]